MSRAECQIRPWAPSEEAAQSSPDQLTHLLDWFASCKTGKVTTNAGDDAAAADRADYFALAEEVHENGGTAFCQ